jgi:hypothetical protein
MPQRKTILDINELLIQNPGHYPTPPAPVRPLSTPSAVSRIDLSRAFQKYSKTHMFFFEDRQLLITKVGAGLSL